MVKPKLPSASAFIEVTIVFLVLMIVFRLFPALQFWNKFSPIGKSGTTNAAAPSA